MVKTRQGRRTRKGPRKTQPIVLLPEAWDEDRTPFRTLLFLDGQTYRPQGLFDVPPGPLGCPVEHYDICPGRGMAYCNRILPQGTPLATQWKWRDGGVVFSTDVVIPTLLDLTRQKGSREPFPAGATEYDRVTGGAVWMSVTPMEVFTLRGGVQAAEGTVVLGGLGLGWMLRKVCEKDTVERVVVVERSRELLDWYGMGLCRKQPKVSDVICDDIYAQVGRHGDQARYLIDIWLGYEDSGRDPLLKDARRRLGRRLWAWGL